MRIGYDNSQLKEERAKLPKADGKHCILCGKDLPKGQKKYCSYEEWSEWYWRIPIRSWGVVKEDAKKRDNFTCQDCGEKEKLDLPTGNLEVHHIKPCKDNGDEFDLSNCVTLCKRCHLKRHREIRLKTKHQTKLLSIPPQAKASGILEATL